MSLCFCCCVFLSLVSDSFLHTGVLSLLVCLFLGNLYTILQHCDQEKCLIQFQFFKIYPEKKKIYPGLICDQRCDISWKTFCVHLRKKWNILFLDEISYRYQLDILDIFHVPVGHLCISLGEMSRNVQTNQSKVPIFYWVVCFGIEQSELFAYWEKVERILREESVAYHQVLYPKPCRMPNNQRT